MNNIDNIFYYVTAVNVNKFIFEFSKFKETQNNKTKKIVNKKIKHL